MSKYEYTDSSLRNTILNCSLVVTLFSPLIVYLVKKQESVLMLSAFISGELRNVIAANVFDFNLMYLVFYYGSYPLFFATTVIGLFFVKLELNKQLERNHYGVKHLTFIVMGSAAAQLIFILYLFTM